MLKARPRSLKLPIAMASITLVAAVLALGLGIAGESSFMSAHTRVMDGSPGGGLARGAVLVLIGFGVVALVLSLLMIATLLRLSSIRRLRAGTGAAYGVAAILSVPVLLVEVTLTVASAVADKTLTGPGMQIGTPLPLITAGYITGCVLARRALRNWLSSRPVAAAA